MPGLFDFLNDLVGKKNDNPLSEAINKLEKVKDAIDNAKTTCKGESDSNSSQLEKVNRHLDEAITAIKKAENSCSPTTDEDSDNKDSDNEDSDDEDSDAKDSDNKDSVDAANAAFTGGSYHKKKKSRKFALKHAKRGRKTVKKGRKSEWNTFVTAVYKKNKMTNPMYMFKNALKDAAKIYKK